MNSLLGIEVITSHTLTVQYRFPRSKKKRIRKKWAAVNSNWRPYGGFFKLPTGAILCHPTMLEKLKRQLAQ